MLSMKLLIDLAISRIIFSWLIRMLYVSTVMKLWEFSEQFIIIAVNLCYSVNSASLNLIVPDFFIASLFFTWIID